REEQRSAAAEMVANRLVRLPAEEPYFRPGQRAQPPTILTGADHHELSTQAATSGHGQVDPFVGGERRHHEVIVLARHWRGSVEIGIHRRINDHTISPIALADAVSDGATDGDEMRHSFGCRPVPGSQPVSYFADEPAGGTSEPVEVGVAHVPGISHRREAIAD